MSYRKNHNSHEIWQRWITENAVLLGAVPSAVLASERVFRAFATTGSHKTESGPVRLGDFGDGQVAAIWEFVNLRTELDMDAALFDALNREYRRRASGAQ